MLKIITIVLLTWAKAHGIQFFDLYPALKDGLEKAHKRQLREKPTGIGFDSLRRP
jgi:hypothetical protein